jgi:hypothetical protein
MVGKVIHDDDAPELALDGLRFHDQRRFQSSEVTRAFSSVIRAVSLGPQSEVSEPDEVVLEPDVDVEIVRGVD